MQSRPKNRAGIDHGIATNFGSIADNRAEFREAGCDVAFACVATSDFTTVEFHVRQDHARAEVRA